MFELQISKNDDKAKTLVHEKAESSQISDSDSSKASSDEGDSRVTGSEIVHATSDCDPNPFNVARSRSETRVPAHDTNLHSIYDSTLNTVDNLLEKKFSKHTYEEQLEIKRLGPHQPQDIKVSQKMKSSVRNFSTKWFERMKWLTISVANKKFYCFYCLLFEGDTIWSSSGFSSLKNLSEKVKNHSTSKVHLACSVKCKLFGVVSLRVKPKIEAEDSLVDNSRNVLERILRCIKFCAENGLRITESELFSNLVGEVAKFDDCLKEHIQDKFWTSTPVLNGLLDAVHFVYQQELALDVQAANYVSIQIDYLPSKGSKFAIFLRYMKNYEATERLYSFIKLEADTTECLAGSIKKELQRLDVLNKLIAQSYSGSITVGSAFCGIQAHFPKALYIHSCAHSLHTIICQSCSLNPCIASFFANAKRFAAFFAKPSRQTDLLISEFNTHSVSWNSELEIITSLYHNPNELSLTFEKIKAEYGWSDKTVWQASSLGVLINDHEFTFLVRFFYTIFNYVEVLLKKFDERQWGGEVMTAVQAFESSIVNLMEVVKQAPESRFRTACIDSCGIVISEARERIQANDHLITFAVIDPKKYKQMPKFPTDHLSLIECRYRMLNHKKLINELKSLYGNSTYFNMTSEGEMLKCLNSIQLTETFSELCQFIEISLATPKERIGQKSASEKLQEFLQINSQSHQSREFVLAVLGIHCDVIDNISNFSNKVIDHYKCNGNIDNNR